jgi:4-hydroxy-2-oxoheptanedioate aldolase
MQLKRKLQDPDTRLTIQFCSIPSPAIPQAMAAAGSDCVVIDMEHGAIDYAAAHAMIAATAGTECAPMVRVVSNDDTHVKRALDMGAEGIVIPMVRTADDARRAVASMRYPPNGNRGFGPLLAHARWNMSMGEYAEKCEPQLVCCLLLETKDGVKNIDEICAVPGVDLIMPAPYDLSTDLGVSGQFDHPIFKDAVSKIDAAADRAKIPRAQIATTRPAADQLFAAGYKAIVGIDALWLHEKTAEMQGWTK